jgi:hypothetical protein
MVSNSSIDSERWDWEVIECKVVHACELWDESEILQKKGEERARCDLRR